MSTPTTKAAESANRAITWQPGDVLAFAGRGWESRVIALKTCSWRQLFTSRWVSHVGIIGLYQFEPMLFESTGLVDLPCEITGKKIAGVQAHKPQTRIDAYDGQIWRFSLKRLLDSVSVLRLSSSLHDYIGTPYDTEEAVLAGTHWIKRWKDWWNGYSFKAPCEKITRDAAEKLFCSELVTMVLREVNVVPWHTQPHWWTPAGWCRWATGSGQYRGWERVK